MTVFHGNTPRTHEIRGKLFMKTCAFAGHREVFASGVEADIDSAIETILANDSFTPAAWENSTVSVPQR